MKKCVFFLLVLVTCTAVAQHQFVPRQIVLTWRYSLGPEPPIIPDSYDDPLGNPLNSPMPCDIEAYQTEDGVEIIVNDVSLSGFYQISVFNHRLDRVYNTSVLFYDGASTFISTATWPDDTYYLQIIIPGGWLEGEFEIDDFLIP